MKVKEIYIKEFRQFKDFTLDLTYPKGHAKEGLPLDKVCFIGQSGTGKTNLLKLLYMIRVPGDWKNKFEASIDDFANNIAFKLINSANKESFMIFKKLGKQNYNYSEEGLMSVFDTDITYNNYEKLFSEEYSTQLNKLDEITEFLSEESRSNGKLIYYPTGLKYESKKPSAKIEILIKKIYDFSKENIYELWSLITEDIIKYQEEIIKYRQRISILSEEKKYKESKKEVENLEIWKNNNINPLIVIAEECINPLIKNFSLHVKEEAIIEKKEDIGFIKLENLVKKELTYNNWSSGTKQVILSALPLYLIQPENSTILFDEPETSLYPDLQRIIIDYYQGLVKENNQFFYATHSPIIASRFEPWEIVELKFNDEGFVYREKYYEGENHVDNYYIDPRYLNFDLTLKEVFDLEDTSGEKRYEALTKYGMLRNQLETLKTNGKLQTDEAKAIFKEFKSLSKKLAINPTQQYAQA